MSMVPVYIVQGAIPAVRAVGMQFLIVVDRILIIEAAETDDVPVQLDDRAHTSVVIIVVLSTPNSAEWRRVQRKICH